MSEHYAAAGKRSSAGSSDTASVKLQRAHQTFTDPEALNAAINHAVVDLNAERNRDPLGGLRNSAYIGGLIGTEESGHSSECEACESGACAVESLSPFPTATVSVLMRSSRTPMPRKNTTATGKAKTCVWRWQERFAKDG
jgi:hypothetical protein